MPTVKLGYADVNASSSVLKLLYALDIAKLISSSMSIAQGAHGAINNEAVGVCVCQKHTDRNNKLKLLTT